MNCNDIEDYLYDYLTNSIDNETEISQIEDHLQQCKICQQKADNLELFLNDLTPQLSEDFTEKVLSEIKNINHQNCLQNCNDIEDYLYDYLTNSIDNETEISQIEDHLQQCKTCQQKADSLELFLNDLTPQLSEDFTEKVLSEIKNINLQKVDENYFKESNDNNINKESNKKTNEVIIYVRIISVIFSILKILQKRKAAIVFCLVLFVIPMSYYYLINNIEKVTRGSQFDNEQEELLYFIDKYPDNPEAYISLGKFYEKNKLYKEALKNYKKAFELDPNNLDLKKKIELLSNKNKKIDEEVHK